MTMEKGGLLDDARELAQSLLRPLALGDVFINAEHAKDLPGIVDQRELAGSEPNEASVGRFCSSS